MYQYLIGHFIVTTIITTTILIIVQFIAFSYAHYSQFITLILKSKRLTKMFGNLIRDLPLFHFTVTFRCFCYLFRWSFIARWLVSQYFIRHFNRTTMPILS